MKRPLLLYCLCVVLSICHADSPQAFFQTNSHEVLVATTSTNSQSTLHTFSKDALVSQLTTSSAFPSKGYCHLEVANSAGNAKPVSSDAVLLDVMSDPQLQEALLVCAGGDNIRLTRQVQPKPHSRMPLTPDMLQDKDLAEKAAMYWLQHESEAKEYPFDSANIMGDTIEGALGWVYQFITHHWGPLHPFPFYNTSADTGIYHLNTGSHLKETGGGRRLGLSSDTEVRIGLSSDWGAGTRESDYVQQLMVGDGFDPHYTLHIGDVYRVGTTSEMESNVLGIPPPNTQKGVKWPHGSIGAFALNGNHETYSRCYGYFDRWLPTLGIKGQGQKASYFMLENDYWRLIALDTGYHTYSATDIGGNNNNTQPQEVMDWLVNDVKIGDPTDKRGIVFFSHHEYVSSWGGGYLATPKQLAELLPQDRKVLWLWGHEHRLVFYNVSHSDDDTVQLSAYGRCTGVGGFPIFPLEKLPSKARQVGLQAFDSREYELENGLLKLPVGFNGFSRMRLNGDTLSLEYYSLALNSNGTVTNTHADLLVTESFTTDNAGSITALSFDVVNKNVTVVQHE